MKNILTSFLILLSLFMPEIQAQVFVPFGDEFVEKKVNVEKKSINNICKYLGYNKDQTHTYFNFDKLGGEIKAIIFEVFTESIICVITDEKVKNLTKSKVNNYLTNFIFSKEYDSYSVESILSDGIENKSLTSEFCSKIFSNSLIKTNSIVVVPQIGYELEFKNGILSSFKSSDGLNKWAKEWKINNPEFYNMFESAASLHWGNDNPKILNEINIQADAYSRIPDGAGNEYVNFHSNDDGTINFKMLLVAHYNEPIKLTEFKEINKGRYNLVNEFNEGIYKRTTYQVNQTYFTFGEDGSLINSYTSK